MARKAPKPPAPTARPPAAKPHLSPARPGRTDETLDDTLDDSFPASDPPSQTDPMRNIVADEDTPGTPDPAQPKR